MTEQLPGFSPLEFAVPFGSYGQDRTNDARIPGFMSRLLRRHFQAVFMTDPPEYTTPTSSHSALGRIELNEDTSTDTLYRWLRDRIPSGGRPVRRPPSRRRSARPRMTTAPRRGPARRRLSVQRSRLIASSSSASETPRRGAA